MILNIVTGESGQGKTEYVIDQMIRQAMDHSDRNYYLIVPEQFSLEMQRKVIEKHPKHGFMNIDVLSFHRLAYRIFEETGYRPDDILEDLGVSMILKKIMSRKKDEFLFFRRSMNKPGFVDEVRSVLMELIGYGIHWQDLAGLAEKLEEHHSLAGKCDEISRLFRYFTDEIRGKYMVTEQLLDVAGEQLADSDMFEDTLFFFDGFTGFTPVQLSFLLQLASCTPQMTVTVTAPDTDRKQSTDLFSMSQKMMDSLIRLCKHGDITPGKRVHISHQNPPRFQEALDIARLSGAIFRPRLIHELSTSALQEKAQDESGSISMTLCANPDGEAEYVLHEIEKLVRTEGFRYRDCAVLAGDVSAYGQAFVRQAQILDIPLFVDIRKKVSYNSGVEAIRALFHLAQMDYTYESVFRYLKSGMSGLEDKETDFLENYVLCAGVRGLSMWDKPFKRRKNKYSKEQLELLEDLRERVVEETASFCRTAASGKSRVRDVMTSLYDTLLKLKYPERLSDLARKAGMAGDHTHEREYSALFALILSLMDKMVTIFGEDRMELSELSLIMDAGLESLGIGIAPVSMDQVILGDLKRTRLPEIKALFIVGFNDGIIPALPEERGIFSDEDKRMLRQFGLLLSPERSEKSMEEEFYIYLAFSRPSEKLYFSLSDHQSTGEALRPSPLIPSIKKILPGLTIRSYPGETDRRFYNREDSREYLVESLRKMREEPEEILADPVFRALCSYWSLHGEGQEDWEDYWEKKDLKVRAGRLSPEFLDHFYGKEIRGSVTKLETFASCPYKYYCTYGLNLREREEYVIRPSDMGIVFHRALELYSRYLKEEGYHWNQVPEERQKLLMTMAVKQAAEENFTDLLEGSARNRYRIHTVERIFQRSIRQIEGQLAYSEFEPDSFELPFGGRETLSESSILLSGGRALKLKGVIDRVDLWKGEGDPLIRIVDYKSGQNRFDMDRFYYGLQLQLVLYMNAAKAVYQKSLGRQVVPAGMFYYQMQDPMLSSWTPEEDEYAKLFRMSGYANADPDIVRRLEDPPGIYRSMSLRKKKDGTFYADSRILTTEDFEHMGNHAIRKVKELGERIYSGDISALPALYGQETACRFCAYRSVCGFDPFMPGHLYREFPKMKDDRVLEAIRKEED